MQNPISKERVDAVESMLVAGANKCVELLNKHYKRRKFTIEQRKEPLSFYDSEVNRWLVDKDQFVTVQVEIYAARAVLIRFRYTASGYSLFISENKANAECVRLILRHAAHMLDCMARFQDDQ